MGRVCGTLLLLLVLSKEFCKRRGSSPLVSVIQVKLVLLLSSQMWRFIHVNSASQIPYLHADVAGCLIT